VGTCPPGRQTCPDLDALFGKVETHGDVCRRKAQIDAQQAYSGESGGLMQHIMRIRSQAVACLAVLFLPAVTLAETLAVPVPQPAKPPSAAGSDSAAGSAWNTEVAPSQAGEGLTLDARQTELVNKVSQYFSGITTLQGRFVQTGADNKRMRGEFFVKRPGLFRFNYARPSRQVIVSDGRYLAIQDLDLNNEDRVAVNETPFRLLLRSDVNLVRDARIIEVQEADDMIVLALEDKSPNTPGQIKLFMTTKPALELKEWVTRDAQGLDTRVEVSDLNKSVDLDGNLFVIKPIGKPMSTP
jgi:outer membrane lipoprotein-sorting protein